MNTPAMMESYGSWMDMDAITASRSSFSDTDATLKTYGGLPPSAFSLSSIASISPSLDPEDYNALGWRAAEPHSSLIRGAIGLDVTQNLATVPGTYDEQTPIGQVTNPFKPYERLQPALAKRNNSMYAEKGFSSFGSSKSRIQERAPKSLPQEPRTPRAAVIPGSREQSAPFGRFDVYAEEEASETAPTRFIISKQAREILQSFLNQRPYPSKEEQEQLARKTNLATCQVKIWFNNNRYRSAKKGN
jgi:hypothetical protein